MANFVYNHAKHLALTGALDLSTADVRVILVMTNTTADTEDDPTTVAGFTTLDEFDGSGYSSGGVALTGEAVAKDAGNNRSEFDATDATFTAIGAGTRDVQAALAIVWGGSLGASIPLAFIDTGGFPFTANGSNVVIQWNAEGILQGA
jgi:hypothetical protein